MPSPVPTYPPEYRASAEAALETALSTVPAYNDWRRYDRGPATDIIERYQAMPVLTKHELRERQPAGFVPEGRDLTAALTRGEVELVKTSGSTADAVTNVWCQAWWDASEVSSWTLHSATASARLGGHREAILSSPRCVGYECEAGYLSMAQRTLGHYLFLTEKSDPAEWSEAFCDRMLKELAYFEPVVLEANPSYLSVLCRHVRKQQRRVYQPAVVMLTYENPSLVHLRWIRSVFQCPVVSSYGATESGYVFMQCEAGRFHQNVEQCHVDFQPLAGRHGGPLLGRILVSTFHNPWRSLLRFDIGDLVKLAEPCPCGRHDGLTLESIEGRVANATCSTAGRLITENEADSAIAQVEGIDQYELVQQGPATILVRYVSDAREPAVIEPELCGSLRRCYGASARILLRQVQALSPERGVKYRLTKADVPIHIDEFLAGIP